MKTTFLVLVGAYLLLGASSAYRAFYQVHSLDLDSGARELHAGSIVSTRIVSYARTHITVRLELIQGEVNEELASFIVAGNDWGFFDPRPRRETQAVVVTGTTLGRFRNGPALLRVTATGREQWMRLPPPVVRESAVLIENNDVK
jgi:hypothetical protein